MTSRKESDWLGRSLLGVDGGQQRMHDALLAKEPYEHPSYFL